MDYQFFDEIFLRTPFFSYARYDLQRLPDVLGLQVFRNAIRLASPVLFAELEKRDFAFERLSEREQRSLAKYYNRMCFRPTPFGGFAAFSLISWAGRTGEVRLAPEAECRLWLLPDNEWRTVKPEMRLVTNPSLYRFEKSWRYYRSRTETDGRYRFSIDALDAVRLNNELLTRCRGGEDPAALTAWLQQVTQCAVEEAKEYLAFLSDEQVLLDGGHASPLQDEVPADWPVTAELPSGNFYAATERPAAGGGLAVTDRDALSGLLAQLQRLTAPVELLGLQQFVRDFKRRFDRQKVPLLTALDPDMGIPFAPTPALGAGAPPGEGLNFESQVSGLSKLEWSALRQLLFNLWKRADRGERDPLVISKSDLAALPPQAAKLYPNTLAVMFRQTIYGLQLEHVAGVSGTQLLGRFSLFSGELAGYCRKMAAYESAANPGVVFADIGQRSHQHYDNVNRRRPIYAYELPLNVISQLSPEQQLQPADLLLSLQGEELILESKRLRKRVIPRLTSAYNYQQTNLAAFQLLCELQYQSMASGWSPDPKALLPELNYYPRLMFENVVLAPASWRFSAAEWLELGAGDYPAFRRKHGLPAMIALGRGDQQLVLEPAVGDDLRLLLALTQGLELIEVNEYLPPLRTVKSGHKPLAAQFVAFCGHQRPIYSPLAESGLAPQGVQRIYQPGSDWLYLKLYGTPATTDRLLWEVIRPVLKRLAPRIRCWFFIRYADPEPHLRLRFQLKAEDNGVLLAALQTQLKRSSLAKGVWGLQVDAYQRELERYGARWIVQVESIFEAGSNWVINAGLTDDRMIPALAIASEMVACFFARAEEQLAFVEEMSRRFQLEFKVNKAARLEMDRQYRQLRIGGMEPVVAGTETLMKSVRVLVEAMSATGLPARRSMLADLMHMQLNRHFPEQQRQSELRVYYFLAKQLTGRRARLQ